jgi:hypothetical protein
MMAEVRIDRGCIVRWMRRCSRVIRLHVLAHGRSLVRILVRYSARDQTDVMRHVAR